MLSPEYRSLGYLPWAHCYGQTGFTSLSSLFFFLSLLLRSLSAELHTMMAHGCSIGIVDNIQRLVDYLPEVKPSVMMNVPTLFNRVYSRVMETRDQMTVRGALLSPLSIVVSLGAATQGVKAFLFDKALHYGKEMIPYIVDDRENEVPFSTYLPYTILNHLVLDKVQYSTVLYCYPYVMIIITQIRERFGGNLKYATCGGAGCPREVLDFMWAIGKG